MQCATLFLGKAFHTVEMFYMLDEEQDGGKADQ